MALLTVSAKANFMECGIAALGRLAGDDNNTADFQCQYDLEFSAIGRHIKEQSEKCKSLAQSVKRVPYSQWLANPNFRESIPPRDMADTFVDLYFRTSESLYRILHVSIKSEIPSCFRLASYCPSTSNLGPAFLTELTLFTSDPNISKRI